MPCLSHPFLFDHYNNNFFGVEYNSYYHCMFISLYNIDRMLEISQWDNIIGIQRRMLLYMNVMRLDVATFI
jgi:hypothetical protein